MPRQTQSYEDNENYLLLSKVSHEIRNPVALINSFLQLLAVNHPELKDDNCFLKIEENMDFLKGLLDELSTYNHSHTANTEDTNPYLLLQVLPHLPLLCWNPRGSSFSSQKKLPCREFPSTR